MCPGCFDKQRRIDELQEEVVRLKQKLRYEEQKTAQGYFGSSTPSAKKPFKAKGAQTKKNGGGQIGHKGYGRKKIDRTTAEVTEELLVNERCPYCEGLLRNNSFIDRPVIDSTAVTVQKIVYRCQKRYCPRCRKSIAAKVPVLPRALYGNQIIAQALNFHYGQGIPVGRIVELFSGHISSAVLHEIFRRVAGFWEPAVERLILDYRQEPVKHADETGWRTDGDNGYAWLFCSRNISIFRFEDTRSSRIPLTVLGNESIPGTLVVDRYGGYNKAPCAIQYCYEHLRRLVEDTGEEFPDSAEVQNFVNALVPLLVQAIQLRRQPISDPVYYRNAKKLHAQIQKVVNAGSEHAAIQSIQRIFKIKADRLYRWVDDRRIPADNNRAERELRPSVIARKVSFGSQSKRGAKTRSTLMTIIHTARKRLPAAELQGWLKKSLDAIAANLKIDTYSLLPPPIP